MSDDLEWRVRDQPDLAMPGVRERVACRVELQTGGLRRMEMHLYHEDRKGEYDSVSDSDVDWKHSHYCPCRVKMFDEFKFPDIHPFRWQPLVGVRPEDAAAEKTSQRGPVVDIDFFQAGDLPPRLAEEAKRQGFTAPGGLVAVKTRRLPHSPLPSYDFEFVGSSPAEIKAYMYKLSWEDGADLGEVVKRAFGEEAD